MVNYLSYSFKNTHMDAAISAIDNVHIIMPTHVMKNIQMAPAGPPFSVEIPAVLVAGSRLVSAHVHRIHP